MEMKNQEINRLHYLLIIAVSIHILTISFFIYFIFGESSLGSTFLSYIIYFFHSCL